MENQDSFEKLSDEELVPYVLKDQNNFTYLLNRYKDKLHSYIRRISSFTNEEAEDVLQEVFLKIYLNLNDFDESLKFSSWVYRITHNQVISTFRKNKARPQSNSVDLDDNAARSLADDFDVVKELDNDILSKKINEVLKMIDDKYKEIIVLKFIEQKSYKEISDILKIPMGTVASLMNRAKKRFMKEWV